MLEEYTTKEHHCVVRSLWARGLNVKDINKKRFLVYGGKCLSRKAVHNWVKKFSQGRSKAANDARPGADVAEHKSKDFHAAGFDALVKRWDKCINVGGGYVEKYMFYPNSCNKCFTFYISLWYIY
jgi:hypothetical protein